METVKPAPSVSAAPSEAQTFREPSEPPPEPASPPGPPGSAPRQAPQRSQTAAPSPALGAAARGPGKPEAAAEPSLLRLRPSSLQSQDISHLLTSLFKNLYTLDVIGEDLGSNLIQSRGGENLYHEKFVDELQKLRDDHTQKLANADEVERHIIQARARIVAEEEKAMNISRVEGFGNIYLPPVKSTLMCCVDNELMKKNNLICPDEYISNPKPISRAPKGGAVEECLKLTFSCGQHILSTRGAQRPVEMGCKKKLPAIPSDVSLSTLTKSSTLDMKPHKIVKKSRCPNNKLWMNHLNTAQRVEERRRLNRFENLHNFLKNPRFYPPNTVNGGKSLIFPLKKTGPMGDEFSERNFDDAPVFLAKPPVGFFTDYIVGPVYEVNLELQNMTSTSRHLRVIPPSTPYFSLGLGKFPGEGGMVAPGMICQYTVRFAPDSLGDFDDFVLVETQSAHTLLIPLQARRPPPILTLAQVLDCGYCLVGGIKMTGFVCKNVGLSAGRFCIMPKPSWPPPSFRAIATVGFVEQAPFGILPAVFQLAPGQALLLEVLFLPTSLETVKKSFIIVCDNCQLREVLLSGTGQVIALELLYVSGDPSHPEPGELTDLTAQHFIRFDSQNIQTSTSKHLIIRNATHVALPFHWQIVKPNLLPLLPGELWSPKDIKYYPDPESAFYITPRKGVLHPHTDHEFILSFAPEQLKDYHSVIQIVLEDIPDPVGPENENVAELPCKVDDVIALEIEVKGSVEPFQILLEPYAIIIPGENYIGVNVKKDFKMWNNSKSAIRYHWGKISDCHIIEVEPCTGVIEPNEMGEFELNFTGGVPGVTSQELFCKIERSPVPVVLHIEAAFKGPTLAINVSALRFGLIRLGKKVASVINLQNTSQLPARWKMRESPACLQERKEKISSFIIDPCWGHLPPLGMLSVTVIFEARYCQSLQTVLELEVENGEPSYLPVYGEVQKPYAYLESSQLVLSHMYFGVPTEAIVTLCNGTLLPTKFLWGKLVGQQAALCVVRIIPGHGILGPNEKKQLHLKLKVSTMNELTDLALPCQIGGMKKSLVLGISGKPKGLDVTFSIPHSEGKSREAQEPGSPSELFLDFGSNVPLRCLLRHQLILTNNSAIKAPFSLEFDYFGVPDEILKKKPILPDIPPALKHSSRIAKHMARKEHLDSLEIFLSLKKGAAFFSHISQGTLDAFQKLIIDITACGNMWGDYHDQLICKVGDLPPTVIPVHMGIVGCPITLYKTSHLADEPPQDHAIRFGTQMSGGPAVSRSLRLNNSSPYDIRIDWEIYNPEETEQKLLDLVVVYGTPFPLRDVNGVEIAAKEEPESDISWVPSDLARSSSSSGSSSTTSTDVRVPLPMSGECQDPQTLTTTPGARPAAKARLHQSAFHHKRHRHRHRAGNEEEELHTPKERPKVISVILRTHDGILSDFPYSISPKQVIIPAAGSNVIDISFKPLVLPGSVSKLVSNSYALGFMSLDSRMAREIPGKVKRLENFNAELLHLDLQAYVRPAWLSIEHDYDGGTTFSLQASDLIPEDPLSGITTEMMTTHHLKLNNFTDVTHSFRLFVAAPFSVTGISPEENRRTWDREEEEEAGDQFILYPQQNMLIDVTFSLSLELLTYQKLPSDQMLPGVKIFHDESGAKRMEFSQELVLEYSNKNSQVVPLLATVAIPALQLSTSWVDFGVCFVNETCIREVSLLNLSPCRSHWMALMDKQERFKTTFYIYPTSGVVEARKVNSPPSSVSLRIHFTARDLGEFETIVMVDGVLGEACTLHVRGQGSYDEKYQTLPARQIHM